MSVKSTSEITQLLNDWSGGDEIALEQLMPRVYSELHRMARQYMNSQPSGHTLQPTALIHEMYVKLAGQDEQKWANRAHFFGVAAQAMRHILVDHARSRASRKRSGGQRVDLDEAMMVSDERNAGLVELDDALTRLSKLDERKGRVVEMKYFGGLSNEEMADVLRVTTKTVIRDWQFARTWLMRELST
ncbi:MAG: sigma-70 family RNA polymerase sigma factor [Acidobacteria bacterium]|nr:sigma-70 family RNA polymerase sigma factor [Acidobacteriota bacterium]